MMELMVGGVAGLLGVILFRVLANTYTLKQQQKMEKDVSDIKKKTEELNTKMKEQDKATQEKINEITDEQSIEIVGDALADFFNNHKSKH